MNKPAESEIKFARCPQCHNVIRYKVGDSHTTCPKCQVKIKLSGN